MGRSLPRKRALQPIQSNANRCRCMQAEPRQQCPLHSPLQLVRVVRVQAGQQAVVAAAACVRTLHGHARIQPFHCGRGQGWVGGRQGMVGGRGGCSRQGGASRVDGKHVVFKRDHMHSCGLGDSTQGPC